MTQITPEPPAATYTPKYNGYLALVKTMAVKAVQGVFDLSYPTEELRELHVSIEYPVDEAHYPGIWVDYSDVQKVQVSGVDHEEWGDGIGTPPPPVAPNGFLKPHTRWKFGGYISFTIAALSSWERDRIYDEMVRVIASRGTYFNEKFRIGIDENPFVAVNMNLDEIEVHGNSAAPGTPWGTDEIIYEKTIQMEIIGEFMTEAEMGYLVPLLGIEVLPTITVEDPLTDVLLETITTPDTFPI